MDKNRQRLRLCLHALGGVLLFACAGCVPVVSAQSNQLSTNSPVISTIPVAKELTVTSVTLAWDPSPDASVVGYRIFWGVAPMTYTNSVAVGKVTTCQIINLKPIRYYFNAKAYNAMGDESVFCGEITAQLPYNPPFTNYVLLDWVRHGATNKTVVSRYVLTNPPGDLALIEALVTQTNDQVRVLKLGRVISINNTNQ